MVIRYPLWCGPRLCIDKIIEHNDAQCGQHSNILPIKTPPKRHYVVPRTLNQLDLQSHANPTISLAHIYILVAMDACICSCDSWMHACDLPLNLFHVDLFLKSPSISPLRLMHGLMAARSYRMHGMGGE